MQRRVRSNQSEQKFHLGVYSERFEDKVMELRSEDKKLTDQTTYNEMKPFLTGVSDGYLHVMTCKARKINKLFGYEYDPVSLSSSYL